VLSSLLCESCEVVLAVCVGYGVAGMLAAALLADICRSGVRRYADDLLAVGNQDVVVGGTAHCFTLV
jgi:hypothetical protein